MNLSIPKKKVITYVSFGIVLCLLFLSCFFEICAYMSVVACLLLTLILDEERCFELILFITCFQAAFLTSKTSLLLLFLTYAITCVVGLRYIIDLFLKKKKLNLKILIPLLVLIVYFAIPPHKVTIINLARYALSLALFYLFYEYREKLNFKNFILTLVFSILISSIFALFRPLSERLIVNIPRSWPSAVCDYGRFSALFTHPNSFAIFLSFAFGGIFALKLKDKINWITFLISYTSLLIIGYLTISRAFLIAFVITLVLFTIYDIVKRKKKALFLNITLYLILGIIMSVFLFETKIYLVKFNMLDEKYINNLTMQVPSKPSEGSEPNTPSSGEPTTPPTEPTTPPTEPTKGKELTKEEWELIFQGKIHYDPGRMEIYKLYIKDFTSSAKNILFGRGISAPAIGQMASHNMFLQIPWEHGIIGVGLYAVLFFLIVGKENLKKLKKLETWKKLVVVLIFSIPYFVNIVAESLSILTEVTWFILLYSLFQILKTNDDKNESSNSAQVQEQIKGETESKNINEGLIKKDNI